MSTAIAGKRTTGFIVEHVRMPDHPKPGRYNKQGKEDPEGNVFVDYLATTVHVWVVFEHDFAPGQSGAMIWDNVAGDGILGAIVSQWVRGGDGNLGVNLNYPNIGEAVILFVSRERMEGAVKVVGRNSSQAYVAVAAAMLYIP